MWTDIHTVEWAVDSSFLLSHSETYVFPCFFLSHKPFSILRTVHVRKSGGLTPPEPSLAIRYHQFVRIQEARPQGLPLTKKSNRGGCEIDWKKMGNFS